MHPPTTHLHTPPAGATRPAFTLIELLVVLALLSLLLTLLLPALTSARAAGQSTSCLSNLRQLAVALDAYALENRSYYAPGAPQISTLNRTRWFGSRPGPSGPFTPTGGPLSDYLASNQGVRRCPALLTTSNGFERNAGGYGYNNAYVGTLRTRDPADPNRWPLTTDLTGSPQTRFANPAQTLSFADAALATTTGIIEYSFIEPDQWPDYPGQSPDPSIHFRHAPPRAPTCQATFLDGHATTLPLGRTTKTSIFGPSPAAANLGWPATDQPNARFDYD
ncbi:MAG: prepilin-type N-terminal cleavage/methylation domain-containing protein [bacterium]